MSIAEYGRTDRAVRVWPQRSWSKLGRDFYAALLMSG